MGKPHTEATRLKISEGQKRAHERRRIQANPTTRRMNELAGKFAQGGTTPAHVRNYGDIGRDVSPKTPVSHRPEVAGELSQEQQAEVTAQALGLQRTADVKARKAGERMQTRDPEFKSTPSPRDRDTLTRQRKAERARVQELKRLREDKGALSS